MLFRASTVQLLLSRSFGALLVLPLCLALIITPQTVLSVANAADLLTVQEVPPTLEEEVKHAQPIPEAECASPMEHDGKDHPPAVNAARWCAPHSKVPVPPPERL